MNKKNILLLILFSYWIDNLDLDLNEANSETSSEDETATETESNNEDNDQNRNKILIVYFTGNTKRVANNINSFIESDLKLFQKFHIQPKI